MNLPTSITVTKNSVQVFHAEAGRFGLADSACRDFIGFASQIIGAAYYHLDYAQAARRIAANGYETSIIENGIESQFQQGNN